MIPNNFKSKARNIAFKSFIKEIEKKGWYILLVKGCQPLVNLRESNIEEIVSAVKMGMRNKTYIPTSISKKNLFNTVVDLITPAIERNYEHQSRGNEGKNESYDYLVHCVNTCIQIFVEHGIFQIGDDSFRKLHLEQFGETVFVRAAKKIFGDDFKLQKPTHQDMMGDATPQNKQEEAFIRKILHKCLSSGLSFSNAIQVASHELQEFRQMRVQPDQVPDNGWGPIIRQDNPFMPDDDLEYCDDDEEWEEFDDADDYEDDDRPWD